MKKQLIEKILAAPVKQWVKLAFAALVIILFTLWLWNFWVLLLLPFVFDIYITKFVPYTWWKKSKNATVRKVFEWVDAILFALVAVYFINLYVFQNYKIPSGSLEKTLLVGDHLFVSKLAYGARTPNTPLSFPLVQHTFPVINTKSYIEGVQWESRRLKGFGSVQRNDIVVFNFPAGDTVALNEQAVDYEQLCFREGLRVLSLLADSTLQPGIDLRNRSLQVGREELYRNTAKYGKITYRPVDRRDNYVKRCVGLPGDTLEIRNREIYIDGKKQERQPGIQHLCAVVSTQPLSDDIYDNLGINLNERGMLWQHFNDEYVFLMPLTLENQAALRKVSFIKSVTEHNMSDIYGYHSMFPLGITNWSEDNYGPIWIPKAGETIAISTDNLPFYERIIRNYEGNRLEVKNGHIYINDKQTTSYTFRQNYYWMMGDNRHNSADSRSWGFVPEDHVVGKPIFVWLSLNQDKGWFSGKIRWNRFFKYAGK